jgi:hypothetical protein
MIAWSCFCAALWSACVSLPLVADNVGELVPGEEPLEYPLPNHALGSPLLLLLPLLPMVDSCFVILLVWTVKEYYYQNCIFMRINITSSTSTRVLQYCTVLVLSIFCLANNCPGVFLMSMSSAACCPWKVRKGYSNTYAKKTVGKQLGELANNNC